MRWPIRLQLLTPSLVLLLGAAAAAAAAAWTAAANARSQIEARLRHVGRFVIEHRTYPLSKAYLEQYRDLSGADYLLVGRDERPTTLADDPGEPPAEAVFDDWADLRLGPPVIVGGRRYLCSGLRVPDRPDVKYNRGDILYIFYPESLWRDALWQAVWPSLLVGGAVGLASVGLAMELARRLSRRLGELERRTRLIAAGDFGPMPLPHRDDELRDLARSVNEMAQRLAQFQETAKRTERLRLLGQVSGGLAHQLRNGVAGARLAVQLFTKETAGRVDASALDVALRQLTLVESNLKRFLDLGRQGPLRRQPCSLTALVGEAVELLRPQCLHSSIRLRWTPPTSDAMVDGDAGQLSQLILNVLGNAVEAAGPNGDVAVELKPGGPCVVEVTDSGPGPSPDVADRLFEPFVTGKPEGVGLGLASAKQTAEAHGGSITWRRQDRRTVFRIELPVGVGGARQQKL
jgi:signal transduction histidine kinase